MQRGRRVGEHFLFHHQSASNACTTVVVVLGASDMLRHTTRPGFDDGGFSDTPSSGRIDRKDTTRVNVGHDVYPCLWCSLSRRGTILMFHLRFQQRGG